MNKRAKSESDKYLAMYPDLHRWMNTCVTCGARGHKPELPEEIYPRPSLATRHLRGFFRPLALNADGMCDLCEHAVRATSPSAEE